MPQRSVAFSRGGYYHIYNRGAGRNPIFLCNDNYVHCLRLLRSYTPSYGIALLCYCLMPNHYHLLLRQEGDRPLSDYMRVAFNAYVQALNRQQGRQGALFQGRFRHIQATSDEQIRQLCRYVHLNPVDARLAAGPEEWPHTNYSAFVGLQRASEIEQAFVASLWGSGEAYAAFVAEGWADRQTLRRLMWQAGEAR